MDKSSKKIKKLQNYEPSPIEKFKSTYFKNEVVKFINKFSKTGCSWDNFGEQNKFSYKQMSLNNEGRINQNKKDYGIHAQNQIYSHALDFKQECYCNEINDQQHIESYRNKQFNDISSCDTKLEFHTTINNTISQISGNSNTKNLKNQSKDDNQKQQYSDKQMGSSPPSLLNILQEENQNQGIQHQSMQYGNEDIQKQQNSTVGIIKSLEIEEEEGKNQWSITQLCDVCQYNYENSQQSDRNFSSLNNFRILNKEIRVTGPSIRFGFNKRYLFDQEGIGYFVGINFKQNKILNEGVLEFIANDFKEIFENEIKEKIIMKIKQNYDKCSCLLLRNITRQYLNFIDKFQYQLFRLLKIQQKAKFRGDKILEICSFLYGNGLFEKNDNNEKLKPKVWV